MPDSQTRERKRSWRGVYPTWSCGFANAQAGVLEIGKDRLDRPTPDTPLATPTTARELILALLQDEADLTQRPLTERVDLTRDGVMDHVGKLTVAAAICRVGTGKATRWEVLSRDPQET